MRQQEVWKEERERGISKMSGLLKFITCGSVDDGKSTLIGHILYDSKLWNLTVKSEAAAVRLIIRSCLTD